MGGCMALLCVLWVGEKRCVLSVCLSTHAPSSIHSPTHPPTHPPTSPSLIQALGDEDEEEDDDEDSDDEEEGGGGRGGGGGGGKKLCEIVWQGVVAKPSFTGFKFQVGWVGGWVGRWV